MVGTQPAIQSLHTDYPDWSSLQATGIESFYAELADEAYKPIQTEYKHHINVGDFRLTREIGHSSSYDYLCVYEEIPPTNTSAKKIFFSLKGSNNLWDYITDATIMHDYSTEGVSSVFDNLYDYLFTVNYNAVVNYMNAQETPTLHQYCLVGHSLGGMLAYDIYTKLVDNHLGGNFTCRLFNPYTLLTERYTDSLQKVQNAVDGVSGFDRFIALKFNVHAYICRGDIFAQTAIWWGPGQVKTYPAKEEIADVNDLSISSITWNASKEMANHRLLNFYENQPHSTVMQLTGTTYYDGETGQVPFNGSTAVLYNKTVRDFSAIRESVGEYHVKVRAQPGDWSSLKGNVFFLTEDDKQDYWWQIAQIPQAFHCYYTDNGSARWVTPIYTVLNQRYNIEQTVFFKYYNSEAGIDYFNIVKLAYNYAFTDANSVLNVPAYTADTLSANQTTGVPINNMGFTQTADLIDPAAIARRLFSFMPITVVPIQDEGEVAWTESNNRRMIHSTHGTLDFSGAHLISNAYSFTSTTIDDRDFDVYLRTKSNDINLRVGYTNIEEVGGADAYKWTLTHNGNNNFTVTNELNHSFTANVFYHSTVNGKHLYVIGIGTNLLEAPTMTQEYVTWGTKNGMLYPDSIDSVGAEYPAVVQNADPIAGSYTSTQLWCIEPATTQYVIQDIPSTFGAGGEGDFMYGEFLMSPNKQYLLYVQGDGGVFWSRRAAHGATTSTYLWTSTSHNDGNALLLRSGRLEVWGGGTYLDTDAPLKWHSNTNNIDYVLANDNGQLQGIDAQGNVVWYVS